MNAQRNLRRQDVILQEESKRNRESFNQNLMSAKHNAFSVNRRALRASRIACASQSPLIVMSVIFFSAIFLRLCYIFFNNKNYNKNFFFIAIL